MPISLMRFLENMRFLTFEITCLLWAVANALPSPTKPLGNYLRARSDASPNPIASQYPNSPTGTINGTTAVVPIPYDLARSIIPAKYPILTAQYESLLPGFPKNSYPLIVRAIIDQNVGSFGFNLVPDFQSIHIEYPFVDLLNDGYSSFTYQPYLLVTNTNLVAILGSSMYGTSTIPASFDPPNVAYGYNETTGTTYLNAYTGLLTKTKVATTDFRAQSSIGPWPFEFYVNATNQPIFSRGNVCDQQISFYNTTLSAKKTGVKGNVTIAAPYLPSDMSFSGVYGLQTTIGFIENNLLSCSSLKGYRFEESD